MAAAHERDARETEEVSDRIFTIPNLISFIRLCMVPAYLILLLQGFNLIATILFAAAAATDFVDGQIARRTHSVSRLGQLLDPAVDRILMITGVLGLFLVGRLPLWIILVVLARDLLLFVGGAWLLSRWRIDLSWLPGFNADPASWGIWFVYAGLVLALGTTVYYCMTAWRKLCAARAAQEEA